MLEYVKTVLLKVSFDQALFEKEMKKARKYLSASELQELKVWAEQQFGDVHQVSVSRSQEAAKLSR